MFATKPPILLGALLLLVSPVSALPTRLLCSETDGVHFYEADALEEHFGSNRVERQICDPDELWDDDCAAMSIYGENDPYTIEFNSITKEAVVERGSEVMFYTIQETKDQIKLIRKRRPIGESTYQSTGFQEFHTYSISIEKDSLASVYTAIFDRTDWGTVMEGGILYTTIINGSCKNHPL